MVALLFTDLVGSTAMLHRLGDDAGEHVLRACLDLLREPVRSFGGREVKSLGDGLLAAFPTTTAALSSAVAMLRALERHNALPGSVPLIIRIGVHAGEPLEDKQGISSGSPWPSRAGPAMQRLGGRSSSRKRLAGSWAPGPSIRCDPSAASSSRGWASARGRTRSSHGEPDPPA